MNKKENKSKSDTVGGLAFVGPLMIGIGLGIYTFWISKGLNERLKRSIY